MRNHLSTLTLIAGMFVAVTLAGAAQDVRIEKDRDDKGNVIYKLTNIGSKTVKAKLQHEKSCSSTTTTRKPSKRDYWLQPRESKQLRKVMQNSDCRHKYRIISAEYF